VAIHYVLAMTDGAPEDDPQPERVVSIPQTLSPSRASDFQNCPLLYRFRTIDRLPEAPSAAAVRGTLVHTVLENLYDLPAQERSPQRAVSLLPEAWADLIIEDPQAPTVLGSLSESEWLEQAAELVTRYFELEDPRRLEPAERELLVEAAVSEELTLRGYVDRLDVNAAGLTRVVDYKTGKAPREAFEGKALFQMRFYALVLWRRDGVIPTQLKLLYLGDGRTLVDQPDAAMLEATERKVLALWRTIREAILTREFPPNPSRLCDWCDHQQRCPAFGGTPPDLPLLQLVPHASAKMEQVATVPTEAVSGLEEA
jgi:putative RecB family exonuclease